MNPTGKGGESTRIVAGRPPQRREGAQGALSPEERQAIAEQLKDEGYRALRKGSRRSLVGRLSILRALQIVEGADGKPEPEDDWEAKLHESFRPRGGQPEDAVEDHQEGEEDVHDEAPEA